MAIAAWTDEAMDSAIIKSGSFQTRKGNLMAGIILTSILKILS
jgi:hypothetical protein